MIQQAWFATPAGRHLDGLERAALRPLLEREFGYYALQLGGDGRPLLESSPIQTQVLVGRSRRCDVRADYAALPFESMSVDLVLAAHVLEFAPDPAAIIREAFRVLRPEGTLAVLGFNPVGCYGLRRRCDFSGAWPWHGDFILSWRLKDWFKLLGLEIKGGAYVGYAPPWLRMESDWLRDRLELAGRRWCPLLGGTYIHVAAKRVPAMRLQPAPWRGRAKKAAVPAAVTKRARQRS